MNNSFPKSKIESIPPSIKRNTKILATVNFFIFRKRNIPIKKIREIIETKKRFNIVEKLNESCNV